MKEKIIKCCYVCFRLACFRAEGFSGLGAITAITCPI